MSTHRLPWSALQDLTDDAIDELLSRLADECERLRRSTPLQTCPHGMNPMADSRAAYEALEASPDLAPCPCIEASCGRRLCCELDDCPPCPTCSRCSECCLCRCEVYGTALHVSDECFACLRLELW